MWSFLRAFLVTAALVPGGSALAAEPVDPLSCATQTFEDVSFVICTVDVKTARPQLFWKASDGQPYRTFAAVAESVAAQGKVLTFAMNAGMYADDFTPMGLYIEDGRELRPANTAKLKSTTSPVPNFYKKPNGVFFLDDAGAGILPTEIFLKRRVKVRFATQSGPMLVVRNELHPAFIPGSTDRKRRSGVGVCEGDTVRFAISDGLVNFHDFARLFRDELKCPNALFLDGGRGAGIYVRAMDREDMSGYGGYGPIIGLVEEQGKR